MGRRWRSRLDRDDTSGCSNEADSAGDEDEVVSDGVRRDDMRDDMRSDDNEESDDMRRVMT